MNTEKKILLDKTYRQFMDTGLGIADPDGLEKILASELMGFGTTVDEKIFGIQQFHDLLKRQKEQSEGMDLHWRIEGISRYISPNEDAAVFADDIFLTVKMGSEIVEIYLRFSIALIYQDDRWLIIHWHGSKPENVQSEDDTFGIENWKQKTAELEKLITERTAELVTKNKELELTLSQLKAAQNQLIQAEKMASLGELTAGIAHEIQNPLNFINNFSEINREMITEMKDEIARGNYDGVKSIANDIDANEDKINHHGKRADAIVKGMLQHSQSGKGQKQLTDINALCDEYLRLSYHGLRAKDKSFNAAIRTDFDNSIGKINIVPQDIGRVLLNLYNNAFYAVNEKAASLKSQVVGYEPAVSVITKEQSNNITIIVSDNGNGIPQNIIDKIFQPFFTTKPTGQGTGLGLSLSYDIIKAHGGEITLETAESEGTTFIIQLPNQVSSI